jgi:hypothetical protein
MKTYIKKLEKQLDWAWAILANAGGGDWEKETKEWQGAVKMWRKEYYQVLDLQSEHKEHITDGTKCWCNPRVEKVKRKTDKQGFYTCSRCGNKYTKEMAEFMIVPRCDCGMELEKQVNGLN